jgi:tRNA threonylcarbamoyladenosine biosynthesis protein TsaE
MGVFLTEELVSNSPQDTFAAGRKIAGILSAGSVVALRGTLGSGKTTFAAGIAGGLGVSENITSPTYTIINEYPGSPVLYHIDVYRLKGDRDFQEIGGVEIINSDGISVIEWSDLIPKSLPENALTVSLEITGPSSRLIKINIPEKS